VDVLKVHLLFVGVPLLLVVVLASLIWSRKGPHPATYQMSEQWTHEPILWAAVDEVVELVGDRHRHGDSVASAESMVGGGASGKW
jgi:hypothetical protein